MPLVAVRVSSLDSCFRLNVFKLIVCAKTGPHAIPAEKKSIDRLAQSNETFSRSIYSSKDRVNECVQCALCESNAYHLTDLTVNSERDLEIHRL